MQRALENRNSRESQTCLYWIEVIPRGEPIKCSSNTTSTHAFQRQPFYLKNYPISLENYTQIKDFRMSLKRRLIGAGERLSGWQHLMLLQRTWVEFTAPTWGLRATWNSGSRGSDTLVCPPSAPDMHVVHMHTCTHIIKN